MDMYLETVMDDYHAAFLLETFQKQIKSGRCKDLMSYVHITEEVSRAGVCIRCILRLFNCTRLDDFARKPAEEAVVISNLKLKAMSHLGTFDVGAASRYNQSLLDATTDPLSTASESTASAESQQADDSKTCTADNTCTLCFGLLQHWDKSIPNQPDVAACDAAPAHNYTHPDPFKPSLLSKLSAQAVANFMSSIEVDYSTFSVDIEVPLTISVHERILIETLNVRYGKQGLFRGQGSEATPLKDVLRRLVGNELSSALKGGKKLFDTCSDRRRHDTADVTLHVHAEMRALDEEKLRPLALDYYNFQKSKLEKQNNSRKKQKLLTREASIISKVSNHNEGDVAMVDKETSPSQARASIDDNAPDMKHGAMNYRNGSMHVDTSKDPPRDVTEEQVRSSCAVQGSQCKDEVTDKMMETFLNEGLALAQIKSIPSSIFRRLYPSPPSSKSSTPHVCAVTARLTRAPLLLAGRYLKLRRGMPQSKWIDPDTGQRIGSISLAERIEEAVLPVYGAAGCKFISGGREDADVRMLGEGRPFVLEILQPKRDHPPQDKLRAVEEELAAADHGARAVQLTPCNRAAVDRIKEAEETKQKTYEVLCWAERPLTGENVTSLLQISDLELHQDTPLRVLHRRAPKIRSKRIWVEAVKVVEEKPCYFSMRLKTEAGTYVKEFCHGDFGRTSPNLGTLLGGLRTEMVQLDVLAVHIPEWP
ncbi:hypothetical protein CEUSTIGMA_g5640.t1 [Chlamydomonas eustigma]|uniref:tRNA pseudouridine(55) synthase n=1 Tax=Chlamydomonas eustigma TaxID=1157962 RepID=A0A250X551_9CHLO|nr:hypothetical protein CEUSTIGMA_g5640.t1 [Chlamydomonas eustigma]|eukprot:GAX78198.1 hypothetical protein CEUSTIGMA_g5640.t1 [Chlamydomonas eustigma]